MNDTGEKEDRGNLDLTLQIEKLQEKYNKELRSIPQVIINGECIGGFSETERHLKYGQETLV